MTIERPIRADGLRNRDAIMDAALRRLADDPRASMTDIANEAGLGRVTLYGHFSSREELIEAVLVRTIDQADAQLGLVDLTGDPLSALHRLVEQSWRVIHDSHVLFGVAETALGNELIRAHHEQPLARVRELVTRGQRAGVMRSDVDVDWLTACFMAVLHEAVTQLRAGRMDAAAASRAATSTIVRLVSPLAPGEPSTDPL